MNFDADVDWTSLAERGEEAGLSVHRFTDQHHFITGIVSELLREKIERDAGTKNKRALKTLLHPEMLGCAFQVLALEKDLDPTVPLAGFRFAREARAAIGLSVLKPNEKSCAGE